MSLAEQKNMRLNFRGLMAPAFTPFTESLELDISKIPSYAEFLKKNGIMGVLVNGTTGEGVSMTVEEREAASEAWIAAARQTGQTIIVQVGGDSLTNVCRMARHAEKLGAAGLLCLPELFFRPTSAQQLVSYLKIVGEAAPNTPLLYYHIPSFTGVNIDMEEFLRLGREQINTLAGVKFTHTDLEQGARCLTVDNGNCSIFLGADQILAGACTLGFDSAIATTLNMFPTCSQEIIASINDGKVKRAQEHQRTLNEKIANITCHGGWVQSMKEAMKIVTGMDFGPPRLPLMPLNPEQKEKMSQYFQK